MNNKNKTTIMVLLHGALSGYILLKCFLAGDYNAVMAVICTGGCLVLALIYARYHMLDLVKAKIEKGENDEN